MPATICSYFMCENKLNFGLIFFGELDIAEPFEADVDVVGLVDILYGFFIF